MGKSVLIYFFIFTRKKIFIYMKRIITAAVLVLFVIAVFAGCGCASNNSPKSSKASSKTAETFKVIETTSDGGTVEQDSDGNTITKDKEGNIKSVKDKNGKALDAGKYIKSHPSVKSGTSSSKSSASKSTEKNNKSKKTSSKSKSGKNTSSKTTNSKNSSKSDEEKEGKIPEIIVDGPEDHYDEEVDF